MIGSTGDWKSVLWGWSPRRVL